MLALVMDMDLHKDRVKLWEVNPWSSYWDPFAVATDLCKVRQEQAVGIVMANEHEQGRSSKSAA